MRRGAVSSITASGGPGFLLAPQTFRVNIHVLDTAPGMLLMFHCSRRHWWGLESLWFLTAHSAPQTKSVSPKSSKSSVFPHRPHIGRQSLSPIMANCRCWSLSYSGPHIGCQSLSPTITLVESAQYQSTLSSYQVVRVSKVFNLRG